MDKELNSEGDTGRQIWEAFGDNVFSTTSVSAVLEPCNVMESIETGWIEFSSAYFPQANVCDHPDDESEPKSKSEDGHNHDDDRVSETRRIVPRRTTKFYSDRYLNREEASQSLETSQTPSPSKSSAPPSKTTGYSQSSRQFLASGGTDLTFSSSEEEDETEPGRIIPRTSQNLAAKGNDSARTFESKERILSTHGTLNSSNPSDEDASVQEATKMAIGATKDDGSRIWNKRRAILLLILLLMLVAIIGLAIGASSNRSNNNASAGANSGSNSDSSELTNNHDESDMLMLSQVPTTENNPSPTILPTPNESFNCVDGTSSSCQPVSVPDNPAPSQTPSNGIDESTTDPVDEGTEVEVTASPTQHPSHGPTYSPSNLPTLSPVKVSFGPTTSMSPTGAPSARPTNRPSNDPTISLQPSTSPSENPTDSVEPSFLPTQNPSFIPTFDPTHSPTSSPSQSPSQAPSSQPTTSMQPSRSPSSIPSSKPTTSPSTLPSSEPSISLSPTSSPYPTILAATYRPGNLTKLEVGLLLSEGLSARLIASSGNPVVYENGLESEQDFHEDPDYGAIFVDTRAGNSGGWVYLSNAEVDKKGKGGVGAITFNSNGNVIDYKMVLTGSINNCGGGKTPWQTFVSCEEVSDKGVIWQVDPFGERPPQIMTMGNELGAWESFAHDTRNREKPRFFATEDRSGGALRRFTPHNTTWWDTDPWQLLHGEGTLDYLVLSPNDATLRTGTFNWTNSLDEARNSAENYYQNTEGIDCYESTLFFVSKEQKELFELDLDGNTYVVHSTVSGVFDGEPDQVARILSDTNDNSDESSLLYFCEEGGEDAGIHARDMDGRFYTILESPEYSDETTGIAFSPDARHMYVAYQSNGLLFDVWRDDGYPFTAQTLNVKYHATATN